MPETAEPSEPTKGRRRFWQTQNTTTAMTWLHPSLLWGLAALAVPIVLHLLMRPKPRKMLFPALRLLQVHQKRATRRLRLRHLWLLLLRMAFLALAVLAVSRPTVPAADYVFTSGEWARLVLLVAIGLGAYIGIMRHWRRRGMPAVELETRRTYLRAGVGSATALLLMLLVGWPYYRRIRNELAQPTRVATEDVPVAAAMLFDTSSSMGYEQAGETRLDAARRIARDFLSRLPADSRVAVGDARPGTAVRFQSSVAAAAKRIDDLRIQHAAGTLERRILEALRTLERDRQRVFQQSAASGDPPQTASATDDPQAEPPGTDRYVREVYLFTDLARTAWDPAETDRLKQELERRPWVNVYLIDVGVESPVNVGLRRPRLVSESIAENEPLRLAADVFRTANAPAEQSVELHLVRPDGETIKAGEAGVQFGTTTSQSVQLSALPLSRPYQQGMLRLFSSDPYPTDDRLYFTVAVRPPLRVLIVAPSQVEAEYLLFALAPPEMVRLKRARYDCDWIVPADFGSAELSEVDVLCFVNVPRLAEADWQRAERFVQAGGGLAVFLGRPNAALAGPGGIDPVNYGSAAARSVLPGIPVASLAFAQPEFLDLARVRHPLFEPFERFGGPVELMAAAVYKYWKVDPEPSARVVCSYSDPEHTPALLERNVGRGRVLMLTTAADLSRNWNELPRSWQFLALADATMNYLHRAGRPRLNYSVRQTLRVPLPPEGGLRRLMLRKPDLTQELLDLVPGQTDLSLEALAAPGHYEVLAVEPQGGFTFRFSANASESESRFDRLGPEELTDMFPEGRFDVARDIEGLTRNVTAGRLGMELFPYLLLLCVLVLLLEQLAANRLYGTSDTPQQTP
ncbi:MAG: hypothetical protein D6725_14205 [Planctomycetota bacterium]|nr:MAG: hypothetical protein D6725_14205 [Planctomycetota bacterium]